jgi:hypothetical protein
MRVLHLDTGREMRGGQWQCLQLVAALGREAVLLAAGPLVEQATIHGAEALPFSLARLTRMSRECDLVHAHDARSHSWAAAIGNAPLVVSRRVAFPIKTGALSRWKYAQPARYIAISRFVEQTLVHAGVPPEKIDVVYDGVQIPKRVASAGKIVALATEDPMKGTALVGEAARMGNFEVCYSMDLDRDLANASVFVYITKSEGLGSAALLAMAWGVPVVASREGGLPEIIEDGVNGMLVPNDPEAIACGVARALERREELALRARRSVEDRFTLDRMVTGTRAAYERVLAC